MDVVFTLQCCYISELYGEKTKKMKDLLNQFYSFLLFLL